jgi:hypothetical protein
MEFPALRVYGYRRLHMDRCENSYVMSQVHRPRGEQYKCQHGIFLSELSLNLGILQSLLWFWLILKETL